MFAVLSPTSIVCAVLDHKLPGSIDVGDMPPALGSIYNRATGVFTPPVPPPAPPTLAEARRRALDRIDAESERRIHDGPGFEYPPASGLFYSLSKNAQVKWLGMAIKAMQGGPWTAIPVHTTDDAVNTLVDSAALALAMWDVGSAVVIQHLGVGNAVKDLVNAATTIADIDAIVSDYLGA